MKDRDEMWIKLRPIYLENKVLRIIGKFQVIHLSVIDIIDMFITAS